MVQYGSKRTQNMKMAEIVKKKSCANYQIFEYIQIFWMKIFIRKIIHRFFLGQSYLDIYLWSFYHAEYIWIFIRPISMVTNIFRQSFVKKKDIRPTLVFRSISECYFHSQNWAQRCSYIILSQIVTSYMWFSMNWPLWGFSLKVAISVCLCLSLEI